MGAAASRIIPTLPGSPASQAGFFLPVSSLQSSKSPSWFCKRIRSMLTGRPGGGYPRILNGFARPCFVIEKVMEIHPKAAVKLEDRQGAIKRIFDLLCQGPGSSGGREHAKAQKKGDAKRGQRHRRNWNVSVLPAGDER